MKNTKNFYLFFAKHREGLFHKTSLFLENIYIFVLLNSIVILCSFSEIPDIYENIEELADGRDQ